MRHVIKILSLIMGMTVFCHVSYAEVLKDPTMPPHYQSSGKKQHGTKPAPKWVLSSTLISPGRRLATINGKTLGVGEHIAGARVVSIDSARVALRDGKKHVVLELMPKDFKRMRKEKTKQQ